MKIPLFHWARENEIVAWKQLVNAYRAKGKLPPPPPIDQNCWAPSGMENMDGAFKWAIDKSIGSNSDLWRFYYGAWLAGRGQNEMAVQTLVPCTTGVARALLARLLKSTTDMAGAAKAVESVREPWLQIHPQVVVERDKVLRSLGKQTIPEREMWLLKVDALKDEWVIERKIQLLIDKEEFQKAKDLLLSTQFQKVHQTYTRSALWMQLCEKLSLQCDPVPEQLGEDRLARFGAYREFE
jgi:hypothetical protein